MAMLQSLMQKMPKNHWLNSYAGNDVVADFTAAVIVTIMLVPQSLAYALLAGLPPEAGLYASILPLIGYAIFGSSRALAVGPVAVVSLLSAAAVSKVAVPGTPEFWGAAIVLAMASGVILLVMGVVKLGWIANYLSHPVISGFVTASGILIALSQMKHLLGISASGHNLIEIGSSLLANIGQSNIYSLALGLSALGFLFWARSHLKPLLQKLKLPASVTDLLTRAGPIAAVVATTWAVIYFSLEDKGVNIVGALPQGFPQLVMPSLDFELWQALLPAALLISLIGFVESISVAQTLAAKKRQRIDPNQELLGLGSANVASALSGGFSVTGGFSRSVVNFDAGARSPMAGVITAVFIAVTAMYLTPWFYFLPKATLAATIIVAVLALVDFSVLKRTWAYSRPDFFAMLTTIVVVLLVGVEAGVVSGVVVSIFLFLWKTSKPHMAIVGQIEGSEHYRNVNRHKVITHKEVLSIRVDESLYFVNARFLEEQIYDRVAAQPDVRNVILQCSAINHIDASALESLEALNKQLQDANVRLHLSEVKGPVMDKLLNTDFLEHMSGAVFMSQHQAVQTLTQQ